MDWLVSKPDFTRGDASAFKFHTDTPLEISAISVQRAENGKVDFHQETLRSQAEYEKWIEHCRPSSTGSSCQPALFLALHKRLDRDPVTKTFAKSTSLPYGEESFRKFCKDLCQHRTLAWLLFRASTAVFSNRSVKWESSEKSSPSTVYHCKSDTSSLEDGNDVVLSATCFLDKPLTLAVMYGCTTDTIEEITWSLNRCADSAFHPLILPMIFAEIERSRFFDAIDSKATELEGRILELEKRVMKETTQESTQEATSPEKRQTMTERDCNAIHLCQSMTSLKNGLVSLVAELGSMRGHVQELREVLKNQQSNATSDQRQLQDGVHIDAKLKAMIAELQSKIRTCEGHLGAMTMATQMEWNYYTRRDAQVNYSIATAARMDGSQMKQISLLGMIFLPGTFLATFFSMTFFSWLPQDSSQVVSPYLGLYFGLTVLVTTVTVLWLDKRSTKEMAVSKILLQQELDKDSDSTLFSRFTFSRSSSFKGKDLEASMASR